MGHRILSTLTGFLMVQTVPPLVGFLRSLVTMREAIARAEYDAVQLARAAGATWEAIGDELGISRQAARRKYGQPRQRQAQKNQLPSR